MSEWNEKLNGHPLFGLWETLGNLLDGEWPEGRLNPSTFESIARIKKVYSYVAGVLEKADPELTPQTSLSSLQSSVNGCINEINAFVGNGNIGHLTNANTHVDNILIVSQQFPSSIYSLSKKDVGESVKAYSDAIDKFVVGLKEKFEEGILDLGEKTNLLEAGLAKEQGALAELSGEVKKVQQVIQQQTSEFNTQFQKAESDRATRHGQEMVNQEAKFTELFKDNKVRSDDEFKNLALRASVIIETLVKLQDDASKVYGVTINTLQAGAYSSYANEERGIANRFRWLAGLLMLIGVGFLIVPEFLALANEQYVFEWKKVVGRIPLSLVVFVPAFYFAKESGRHRSNEVVNRRRQHILSTLDPYIELMDKESAQSLKAEVARSIFAETSVQPKAEDPEVGNLVSQLANLVKQIKAGK